MKRITLGLIIGLFSITVLADHDSWHKDVVVENLSDKAAYGQKVFSDNCASCHGENGSGTLKGPPLIHDIYNAGHHGNGSFINAIRNGVKQHHWPYGDMPSQSKVGFMETTAILSFIREVQKNNGIIKKEHKM